MPKTNTKATKPSNKTNKKKQSINKNKLDIKTTELKRLSSVWTLAQKSYLVLLNNKKLFLSIIVVYAIFDFIFIQGVDGVINAATLSQEASHIFHGQYKRLNTGLTVYGLLVASFGLGSSTNGGSYFDEWLLVVVMSLIMIWAIRTSVNKMRTTLRESVYKGVSQIMPFVGVVLFISLELLPFVVGLYLFVVAVDNSVVVNFSEYLVFIIILLALAALSIYWLSSSIISLYIVTLPDMTPFKALRSAKGLVKNKRLKVIGRLLFLPLALLVISAIIIVPIIVFVAPIAQYIFLLLSFVFLALVHSYLYNLYLELISD